MDEASIYSRPLSASEIKAIYNLGSAGKFDASVSFPQNLAEARVSLAGQTSITINGSNTAWQAGTITFVATTNATSLQIDGLEPGMLLDTATLTSFTVVTNTVTNIVAVVSNLYYPPEQSLDAFTGAGGYGDWQLEIQDDRAGAYDSNSPPVLGELGPAICVCRHQRHSGCDPRRHWPNESICSRRRHRVVSDQRAGGCELRREPSAFRERAGERLV